MGKIKVGGVRGKVRGRVGSESYSILNRQQIVRSLPDAVKNPQTSAQMEQRARLANLVAFYRANKFWMHFGAFENKKETWSDYNAFVSANEKNAPVYLTKAAVLSGATVVAPYAVTSGSLPRINCVINVDTLISDIFLSSDLNVNDGTPVNLLTQNILANNNVLQNGDQLSVIIEIQQSTADTPYVTARAYELILDTEDERTLADLGLSGLFISETQGGNNCLAVQMPTEQCGATIVLSREDGSKLYVSSQTLVLTDAQQTYLASFQTASAKAASFRSYGATGSENFLSAGYSSEASEGVSLPQQILSVNDKSAGQYLGSILSQDNVTINMALEIDSESIVQVSSTPAMNIGNTSFDGRVITFKNTGTDEGPITKISVEIDGETYDINFASTNGGGGEITE